MKQRFLSSMNNWKSLIKWWRNKSSHFSSFRLWRAKNRKKIFFSTSCSMNVSFMGPEGGCPFIACSIAYLAATPSIRPIGELRFCLCSAFEWTLGRASCPIPAQPLLHMVQHVAHWVAPFPCSWSILEWLHILLTIYLFLDFILPLSSQHFNFLGNLTQLLLWFLKFVLWKLFIFSTLVCY